METQPIWHEMTYSSLAKCLPNLKMPTQTATNIFGAIWPPSQQMKPFTKSSKKNKPRISPSSYSPQTSTRSKHSRKFQEHGLTWERSPCRSFNKIVRSLLIVLYWKQTPFFTQSPLSLPMAPWMLMVQSRSTHVHLMHIEGTPGWHIPPGFLPNPPKKKFLNE